MSPAVVLASKPELVLLLAVDQLRRDRITTDMAGGLGRLMREGQVFAQAQLAHGISTTCPGHVTMVTGRYPGASGVPDNTHLDRSTGQTRYCVADDDSPMLGGGEGRSPSLIKVDALGDWLQQATPQARVLSIATKDRAAIAMAGQRPSAAVWFDRQQYRMNTSTYYAQQLPAWVAEINEVSATGALPRFLQQLPQQWQHGAVSPRVDDFVGESKDFERASPHPLGQGDRASVAAQYYMSPWADSTVIDLAQRAITSENLLNNGVTDLVMLSFAATDTVGHLYGPFSAESADTLRRLDVALQHLLEQLQQQVTPEQLLVVLSADHGVAALPEYGEPTSGQQCPVPDGRIAPWRVVGGLMWHLYKNFTAPFGLPTRLLKVGGTMLYVSDDPKVLNGHNKSDVVAAVEQYLEQQDYVHNVWTVAEMSELASTDATAALYWNSYDADTSGDLIVQMMPGCLFGPGTGTTHGSPYAYDRDIPLIFWGAGIGAGVHQSRAASVDIAPTIAHLLGLPAPANLDGRILPVATPTIAKPDQ